MTASGEDEVVFDPSQTGALWRLLARLGGAVAGLPVIRAFARLWGHMLDDLAANGVVETVFATATRERILMLGVIVFIAVAVAFAFRARTTDNDEIPLTTRIAFLAFAFGIPLWLALPYHSLVSAWTKLVLVLLFGIVLAALIVPGSRPGFRAPLLSLLGLLSIVAILSLGAIPRVSSSACSDCDQGQIRDIYRTHPPKPHPTATPSPTPTRESTPVPPTVLPPPVVVTVVVVVEQAPTATAEPTQLPEQAPDSPPEPTPGPTTGCPDLDYPVLRPPGAMHLVQKDENLATLAEQYGTTVQALVQANSPYYATLEERPDCIRDGWWLIIPSR